MRHSFEISSVTGEAASLTPATALAAAKTTALAAVTHPVPAADVAVATIATLSAATATFFPTTDNSESDCSNFNVPETDSD